MECINRAAASHRAIACNLTRTSNVNERNRTIACAVTVGCRLAVTAFLPPPKSTFDGEPDDPVLPSGIRQTAVSVVGSQGRATRLCLPCVHVLIEVGGNL